MTTAYTVCYMEASHGKLAVLYGSIPW